MLERLFHVRAAGSTPGREALGGLTTFLTMAYILAVNPVFLTAAGMPLQGAIVATALSAGLATLLMALLANYPIALAPGMGMNAFFAYGICLGAGVPWPTALGMVFWSGVAFVLLTVTGARRVLVRAVPASAMGDLTSAPALLTLFGLAVGLVLMAAGIPASLFWALAATLTAALLTGIVPPPATLVSAPSFDLPGLRIDLLGALRLEYVPLMLVLLFFALFDTLGTLMGVAHQAGLLRDGELPRIERALAADAASMMGGALIGTSPVTSYIESGAGVAVGARTGLASVVTGLLLLLSLFFTPLVALVGQGIDGKANPVTAPALILVGILMVQAVREIDWQDPTEAAPAFFTALLMPLTFNISHGLAAGIVVYALVKLAARRGREVHWLMYALALLFVLRYALLPV
jgi:AGZA family xanthine/uracil permease-like MFS transporter